MCMFYLFSNKGEKLSHETFKNTKLIYVVVNEDMIGFNQFFREPLMVLIP